MDYVVGSVAALVSGNVTPNRPKFLKRALTPTKHQPSPNVTPKSEFIDDRSVFLSPSVQKKKAVVKKSPKRIFQNPDLDTTKNGDGSLILSPKADKVKKHLEEDLDNDISLNNNKQDTKSPNAKGRTKKVNKSLEKSNIANSEQNINKSTPKKNNSFSDSADGTTKQIKSSVEKIDSSVISPNKIKNRRKSLLEIDINKENENIHKESDPLASLNKVSPKKKKSKLNNCEGAQTNLITVGTDNDDITVKKKRKKRNKRSKDFVVNKSESLKNINTENVIVSQKTPVKNNRKCKKTKSQSVDTTETEVPILQSDETVSKVESKSSKTLVNPNAITDKESDSEHESDNEMDSENEAINKKVFESEANSDESSDEEDDETLNKEQSQQEPLKNMKEVNTEKLEVNTEDEIKRTLFVGNVPFSPKCKKEIKKIFSKHGQIETIRIRTVPVKDGRYTPKLAVIKNELHPERTTVNVYIKYVDEDSVEKALCENNSVLNDHHLRVSRSSHTGKEHDPKCSIFIGNLPFAMEDEVLRQKFEKCGEIESVRIIRDKKTNAGKGFGYVNFASKDGVELALALTEEDLTIKNRIIRVKRCTQVTNKQKQTDNLSKRGFKNQASVTNSRTLQGQNQGNHGGPRDNQRFQKGSQGGFRGNQPFQRGNQRVQGEIQGFQRRNQGGQRENHGFQGGNQGGQRMGLNNQESQNGAYRRILHKRKNQEGTSNDGPPNKMQKNINQPTKEKKPRKEFVGMTAEKKKKRKFDKGQKKKKALSEILTK